MRRGFTAVFREDGGSGIVGAEGRALTVSQLTRRIKDILEGEFVSVCVEGEIGSITAAPSGHLYITLKDSGSVLDVVVWRSVAGRFVGMPQQGDKIEVKGKISLYEPRGRYQLVAQTITPAGEGKLRAEFDLMVERLRAEGLFDPVHKKELPEYARVIGIVTSSGGAAVRDIIKVARKRMSTVSLVVSPCLVQGTEAPLSIISALDRIESWGKCDLIILGRGGGSLEDLAAFSDERVARRVFACKIPVISAVGHEVDVSLCDLVADKRAATPSEASEMAVKEVAESKRQVDFLFQRLNNALLGRVERVKNRMKLLKLHKGWLRPQEIFEQYMQRLDYLLVNISAVGEKIVKKRQQQLALLSVKLEGLSPLKILQRGYSVTRDGSRKVVTDSKQVKPGQSLETSLFTGSIISEVVEIKEGNSGEKE